MVVLGMARDEVAFITITSLLMIGCSYVLFFIPWLPVFMIVLYYMRVSWAPNAQHDDFDILDSLIRAVVDLIFVGICLLSFYHVGGSYLDTITLWDVVAHAGFGTPWPENTFLFQRHFFVWINTLTVLAAVRFADHALLAIALLIRIGVTAITG